MSIILKCQLQLPGAKGDSNILSNKSSKTKNILLEPENVKIFNLKLLK